MPDQDAAELEPAADPFTHDAEGYFAPFQPVDLWPDGDILPDWSVVHGSDPSVNRNARIIYLMASGADPEDLHPDDQPYARFVRSTMQPQPPLPPGPLAMGLDYLKSGGDLGASAEAGADQAQPDADDPVVPAPQPVAPPDLSTAIPDTSVEPIVATPDVQALIKAQNAAMTNQRYKPLHRITHCNQATFDIARSTGVDSSPFGDSQGAYVANEQARRLADAANVPGSGWQAIDRNDAQRQANQGKMVVMAWENPSGGHGHTVTVRPDARGVASNPTTAQVGDSNGIKTFRGSFGVNKRDAVKTYVYMGQ